MHVNTHTRSAPCPQGCNSTGSTRTNRPNCRRGTPLNAFQWSPAHRSKNTRALSTSSARLMASSCSPSFQGSGSRRKWVYNLLREESYHGGLSARSKSNMRPFMYSSVMTAPKATSSTRDVFLLASWCTVNRWWPAASAARRRAPSFVRGSIGDSIEAYCGHVVCVRVCVLCVRACACVLCVYRSVGADSTCARHLKGGVYNCCRALWSRGAPSLANRIRAYLHRPSP